MCSMPKRRLSRRAPRLYPEGNALQEAADTVVRGSVEEGFRQADIILEDKYRTQLVQHVTPEPRVTISAWTGKQADPLGSHKHPFSLRTDLARALGLKVNQIRINTHYIGGDFGDKTFRACHIITALLARKTGRPCRLEYSREDNFLCAHHRYPTTWYLRYGGKRTARYRDGRAAVC